MKVHVIIDFMHIYYKYYFQVKGNKIKKLSTALEWNGVFVEKDISLIYYSLKDIESIRRQMIDLGHDTTVSICFDSPSKRQNESSEANKEYKASRENKLSQEGKGERSVPWNYKHWLRKLKTQINGQISHAHGLEGLILLKCP